MRLLSRDEILRSDIVANRTMNRERVLHGVNSYTRELGFDALAWLVTCAETHGGAAWLDVCCGEGRALIAAAQALAEARTSLEIHLTGIDLVDPGSSGQHSVVTRRNEGTPAIHLEFVESAVEDFAPARMFDLITCVHGLHYLGDKLGFLERAYRWLIPGGILVGHLDSANIRSEATAKSAWSAALRHARSHGAEASLRSHRMRIERTEAALDFGVDYAGAGCSESVNYTGITVIDSWYRDRAR